MTLIQEVSDFEYELLICYQQAKQVWELFLALSYEIPSHWQVAYIFSFTFGEKFFDVSEDATPLTMFGKGSES